jgi:uncharacterized membrane protein
VVREWVLLRNCSFSPRQLALVFGSLCVVSLMIAGFFWVMGAPFVLLFAGLEIVALGVAFVMYARHAADGEYVRLADGMLWVEYHYGSDHKVERFNPHWVRVEAEPGQARAVRLGEAGRALEIGRYVTAQQRRAFVEELKNALRQ